MGLPGWRVDGRAHRPSDLGRLQEELEDQKVLLALQAKKLAQRDSEATQKKIDQLTKQVEKATSTSDGAPVAAAKWELALKQSNRAETERVTRTDAATQKAEERSDRLGEICFRHMEAWEAHLATL